MKYFLSVVIVMLPCFAFAGIGQVGPNADAAGDTPLASPETPAVALPAPASGACEPTVALKKIAATYHMSINIESPSSPCIADTEPNAPLPSDKKACLTLLTQFWGEFDKENSQRSHSFSQIKNGGVCGKNYMEDMCDINFGNYVSAKISGPDKRTCDKLKARNYEWKP